MLARDTTWRQGDLLSCAAGVALGLVDTADEGRRVIVITHDCDLPHDSEHCVEVIVAEIVIKGPKPDPQLSYAKNPRRLHLIYQSTGTESLVVELRHGNRRSVPKEKFAEHAARDSTLALPIAAKRTLKQWLAARYGRPAFPNAFEERLRKRSDMPGKRTVEQCIAKILEPDANHVVGLFFDLGEQRGSEAMEGEPYSLSISVVYDTIEGGSDARRSATRIAEHLRILFDGTFGTPNIATEIALESCVAVADTHLTLADLRRVDQWRLEYISLRESDEGDFLSAGTVPA